MVVTLSGGSVTVSDVPEAACVPAGTGWIGLWPCVVVAVIWKRCAVPDRDWPLIAATWEEVERLMATKTTRPETVVSVLA